MSDETTLRPCPFCGGEASKRLFYKGKYRVHCNDCDAHSGDVCDTEAEAITAWNTRYAEVTIKGEQWEEIKHLIVKKYGDEIRAFMEVDS